MHEDAGRRRRRRMVLLNRPRPPVEEPENPASSPELEPTVVSVDHEYLADCGDVSHVALCIEDLSGRLLREQPLHRPLLKIGRGGENDLWLNHEKIQPRHLLIAVLPGGIYFLALSPEAELKGPQGVTSAGWWTPGMSLRTGAFRLKLKGLKKSPPVFDPLAVAKHLEQELPNLELKFLSSAVPQRPWRITRPVTLLGRSSLCKIRLDHDSILPVHAALVRTSGRLWLINLAPPQATQVNDLAVRSARLDVGDRVRLGDFRVEIQAAATWPAEIGPAPVRAAESAATGDLTEVLKQFAEQQQKMLEMQQAALANLERLARDSKDPSQVQAILEQAQQSCATFGENSQRMQTELYRKLKPGS